MPLKAGEPITLGDLYRYLPLAGHVAVAEFTGGQILQRFERFLDSVFDPNPYRRTGGWVPAVAGLRFAIDLSGPQGPALDRIRKAEVYDREQKTWQPLQEDRVYRMASCYSPGDPLDKVCRTSGARNLRILMRDGSLIEPLVPHQPENPAPKRRVAPAGFMTAIDLVLDYLAANGNMIRGERHAVGRWRIVQGELPESIVSALIVQPLQGAGPGWLTAPPLRTEQGEIQPNPDGL